MTKKERYEPGWDDPRDWSEARLKREYYSAKAGLLVRDALGVDKWESGMTRVKVTGFLITMAVAAIVGLALSMFTEAEAREPYRSYGGDADASAYARSVADVDVDIAGSISIEEGPITSEGGAGGSGGAGGTAAIAFTAPDTTPNVILGLAYPTAPCRVALTIGGSAPGFGAGVGLSKMDDECNFRETSRFLANMGQHTAAYMVLCQTDAMGVVFIREDSRGRTVPDSEGCVAYLTQVDANEDRYEAIANRLEAVQEQNYLLERELTEQTEACAARVNEVTERATEELQSCASK